MERNDDPSRNLQDKARKRNPFFELFPREHDFELMLANQAEMTVSGLQTFIVWLDTRLSVNARELQRIETEVDSIRRDMEEKLVRSFSTPFDRQDIFSISRQMDYILNFSNETVKEMYAFGVETDHYIEKMAGHLLEGTTCISRGIRSITSDKNAVEGEIRRAREDYHRIEELYITSMTELLKTSDPMYALRKREIYHHLRDAGRAMRDTLDILHNAVIDLA